jgi:hypothetical protein
MTEQAFDLKHAVQLGCRREQRLQKFNERPLWKKGGSYPGGWVRSEAAAQTAKRIEIRP